MTTIAEQMAEAAPKIANRAKELNERCNLSMQEATAQATTEYRDHFKRMENERNIVRHLIRHMKSAGWSCNDVDDGGDEFVEVFTEGDLMEAAFAVDECTLIFKKGDSRYGVKLIYANGNMGFDVIADWSYSDGDADGFDARMGEVSAYVEKLETSHV